MSIEQASYKEEWWQYAVRQDVGKGYAGNVLRRAPFLIIAAGQRERKMGQTLEVRLASAADLEALVSLATAFRDHHGLAEPSEADFRTSIARLLRDRDTEFFLALSAYNGTRLGYVQSRYRYSAWTAALEAELEDVFVVQAARRRGVGLQLEDVFELCLQQIGRAHV